MKSLISKNLLISIISLSFFLTSCSGTSNTSVDNKSKERVSAVIDSLMALEPDMKLESLSVVKTIKPSLFADEVVPAKIKSYDLLSRYIHHKAFEGVFSYREPSVEEIKGECLADGAILREAMKNYDKEEHPVYVFGLANVINTQDSSRNEKRIYIFEKDNLKIPPAISIFPLKNMSEMYLLYTLAFADKLNAANERLKWEEIEPVKSDPILAFLIKTDNL